MAGPRCLLSILAAALLLLQATPGSASDYPSPAPIWNGLYVGVHGGVASADLSYTFDSGVSSILPEKFDHNPQGWFGGGQVGLQRQSGRLVVGVEASYSVLDLSDTLVSTQFLRFRHIEINDLFLLTARLGYAFDHWMPYVKAGYANASVDTLVYMPGGGTGSATRGREDGWTVGAGLEFLCGRGFVLGFEYDYVRLDVDDRSGQYPDHKTFTYKSFDNDIHMFSARLSYKFGSSEPRPLK
jgi:outer membrane immunogenic protein